MAYKKQGKPKERAQAAMKAAEKHGSPVLEATASTSFVAPESVPVDVQPQAQEQQSGFSLGDIVERARKNLSGAIGPQDENEAPDEGASSELEPKKSSWKKYGQSKQKEEISDFFGKLLMVAIAAWSVPEELKPNQEEVEDLATVASRLLLRHIDLSGKLTKDAVDAIGIVAIIAGWYTRTAPAWRAYNLENQAKKEAPIAVPQTDDPNGSVDPVTGLFRKAARRQNGQPDRSSGTNDNPS